MNTLRLVFGWLFLAGLTAAGTYYALDEVDQRGGLAGIDLHQKVGVVRYSAARLPVPNQTPPANNITPPANNQTPPSGNTTPPPNGQPPANNLAPPYQQPPRNQAPPYQSQTPYSSPHPTYGNPRRPIRNQTPPYNNQPPQTQLPPDYVSTQTRLVQVMNRANSLSRHYSTLRQNLNRQNLNLRPEQQSALVAMVQFTQIAQRALRAGDTITSRQYMDEAERQMDILEKFRDR